MKKRVTFTVDEEVYEGLKQIPRGVSVSEIVNWCLRSIIEDLKPNGMSDEEFVNFMDSDPRRREVRLYMKEKLAPIICPTLEAVEAIKNKTKHKLLSKRKLKNV